MNNSNPLLSICIPTFKRIELTRNTIASIYIDGVSLSDFEVIVSDNDPEQSSKIFEEEFKFDNFHYHATRCEGFLNSFYVLTYGNGEFLKLQNNVDCFKKRSLAYMIQQIRDLKMQKPILYHSNGMLENFRVDSFNNIDSFFSELNYSCSWSAGFGIWKSDFDKIRDTVRINKWFPQTSLLLSSCVGKSSFVIDDNILRDSQHINKKGGYNTYRVFGVDFLDLLDEAVKGNTISEGTFQNIKSNLFKRYIASRYLKTVILKRDAFDHSNIKEHLRKYYGGLAMIKLVIDSLLYPIRYMLPRQIHLKKAKHNPLAELI